MYFLPGFFPISRNIQALPPETVRTARSEARTERTEVLAANCAFFDTTSDRRKNHQRRCSTADESGVPENDL